jgi:cell division transport system permease protein
MLDLSSATALRAKRGFIREWRLHVLSVFSLAVAFVCLGASLLVVVNLRAVEERWAHAGRASIYLRDDAKGSDIDAIKDALAKTPGVTGVRYVSSGQARSDFARGGDSDATLAGLPAEAFPASLEIDVDPAASREDLAAMKAQLSQLPAVDDVETYEAWTDRLARLVGGGVAASGLLALVVFASVLAVVGSTIRLALQRRRSEVEVLKLVGATPRFVKSPFLIEGSAQGAVGATFAVGVLLALFLILKTRIDGELARMLGVEPTFLPWQAALGMVLIGAVLGAAAASLGLRKLVTV